MSILHALVLGIVQGLTEFFPISSSGHLAIVPWLFGWDDFGNDETLHKAFDVALHMGTLAGALTYFRHEVVRYTKAGFTEPRSPDGRMAWLLLASAVPAAIVGAVFSDAIEKLDDEIGLIAVMLIVFGIVLLLADRLPGPRGFDEWRFRDAALMGLGLLALRVGQQPGRDQRHQRDDGHDHERVLEGQHLALRLHHGAEILQRAGALDLLGQAGHLQQVLHLRDQAVAGVVGVVLRCGQRLGVELRAHLEEGHEQDRAEGAAELADEVGGAGALAHPVGRQRLQR